MSAQEWPRSDIHTLSDMELEFFRTEAKRKASGSREKAKMGHSGREFELTSELNPDRRFRLFIRQSTSNSAVFSVGLALILAGSDLRLCRYNSDHHGHRNILEKQRLPPMFHKHIATARYIAAGLDSDGFAEPATGYSTVQGALSRMLADCAIFGILAPQATEDFFQ